MRVGRCKRQYCNILEFRLLESRKLFLEANGMQIYLQEKEHFCCSLRKSGEYL